MWLSRKEMEKKKAMSYINNSLGVFIVFNVSYVMLWNMMNVSVKGIPCPFPLSFFSPLPSLFFLFLSSSSPPLYLSPIPLLSLCSQPPLMQINGRAQFDCQSLDGAVFQFKRRSIDTTLLHCRSTDGAVFQENFLNVF